MKDDKSLDFNGDGLIQYYYDKPNPYLKKFVEDHIKKNPYDQNNDVYNILPFNDPIKTTKATSIYYMHSYWSKKPHDAIMQYIKHYTKPGDLILDPMCGSGGTLLSAILLHRKAIGIDISPAATFITKNYCTPIMIKRFKEKYINLIRRVKNKTKYLFETKCDRCGGDATTKYVIYSNVYRCPRCLEKVAVYDLKKTKIFDENSKINKIINACPYCLEHNHIEEITSKEEKLDPKPILINYECKRCRPKRDVRTYNDEDIKKREYFNKFDREKLISLEDEKIPFWIPEDRMMNVEGKKKWGTLWRKGVASYQRVQDIYSKRALIGLSILFNEINYENDRNIRDFLLFAFSGSVLNASLLYPSRPKGGITNLSQPQMFREMNFLDCYERKCKDIIKGKEVKIDYPYFMISTESATCFKENHELPQNSVDYIFTDPPYSNKYPYGQLNFIWESWLQLNNKWHGEEIIVAEDENIPIEQQRTIFEWKNMLKQVLESCYTLLKPGRVLSLCYHDSSEQSWQIIREIMSEIGFIPEQSEKILYIDTDQKTQKQQIADKLTKRDLIINYRKPIPGELFFYLKINGNEDNFTFNQKARSIIIEVLTKTPGVTKDRVYDELISRMVRKGTLQAHEFENLLSQVAIPSKTQNGASQENRWYLKDTEFEVDQAESVKEDFAANSVSQFIENFLEKHPENEGVHYSNIFEHYIISVKDKPRRELRDWLLDYFYATDEGTYRPPITEEEVKLKEDGRVRGLSRRIRRFVSMIEHNVPVPVDERPDNPTIVEWILHCRRSGMFYEGGVLYERGGLDLGSLDELSLVEVEEAYHTINKQR